MQTLSETVCKYQSELTEKFKIPKTACERRLLGNDGVPNRSFFVFLSMDFEMTMKFLQDTGLLKREMLCDKCNVPMQLESNPQSVDKMSWSCNKWLKVTEGDRTINVRCKAIKSMRDGSWFRDCSLSIPEVLLITYELVYGAPLSSVRREYGITSKTLVDWVSYCREVYLYYMEVKARKIGGSGKIVEVDESNFGGRFLAKEDEEQWVLGGIERGTGECFFIPIKDRSSDTLVRIIKDWVLPGTVIVSDSRDAYESLQNVGYIHKAASLKKKGTNCKSIEATWRYLKASIPASSKDEIHFAGYLAAFMFHRHCQAEKRDVFLKFMEMIRLIYSL